MQFSNAIAILRRIASELHVEVYRSWLHMKYIINIIIYLRSTITEMRDSEASTRDCGTRAFFVGQSRGIWDGWQVRVVITAAGQGKGQEPRMRSEFRKLRDNRAPPRDRGTVYKFAGQSPQMWDV